MTIDMNTVDLAALNTATKYPSIPNLHMLEGGKLTERVDPSIRHADPDTTLFITEKIDGANGRIIFIPTADGSWTWVIGSRKELLAERGQRIFRNADYIVTTLAPHAETMIEHIAATYDRSKIVICFMESYGRVQNWANYSDGKTSGVTLFDIAEIPADIVQERDPDETDEAVQSRLSAWRDAGNQLWAPVKDSGDGWPSLSGLREIGIIPMVPDLGTITVGDLMDKGTIEGVNAWMNDVLSIRIDNGHTAVVTRAHLLELSIGDALVQKPAMRATPEGLVLRNDTRGIVVKIRKPEYDKKLRGKGK